MIDIEMWARRKGQRTPNKGSWLNAVAIGYQVDLSVYKTNVLQGIAKRLGLIQEQVEIYYSQLH